MINAQQFPIGRLVMPVQKFAPMTKEFPSFDCDANVTEPPWLWERAKDWLTKDEFEALKGRFFFHPESKRLLANGLGQVFPAGSLRAVLAGIECNTCSSGAAATAKICSACSA